MYDATIEHDDYGTPFVGVYTLTHNLAGYMPDDDTPTVIVDTPRAAIDALSDELHYALDAILDGSADRPVTHGKVPYHHVTIGGVVTYYVDARDRLHAVDNVEDAAPRNDDIIIDWRDDINRRLINNGAVDALYNDGAVGVYVDADDTPDYFYGVTLMSDYDYAELINAADDDNDDYAASIVDDVRYAADNAIREVHTNACSGRLDGISRNTTCDIDAAYEFGHLDAAAYMLNSATETPSIISMYLMSFDPSTVLNTWSRISRSVSALCGACGAYTYPDADDVSIDISGEVIDADVIDAYADVSTVCYNCRAATVHVPANIYAVTVNNYDDYDSMTTYVRVRADVDADMVAESYAEHIADRREVIASNDYYGVGIVEIDAMPDARNDDDNAAYMVTTTYDMRGHVDAADYADDDYIRSSYIDVIAKRVDVECADVDDVDRAWKTGTLRGLTAYDVYDVGTLLDRGIKHDERVHVYDVDAYACSTSYSNPTRVHNEPTTPLGVYRATRAARNDLIGTWYAVYDVVHPRTDDVPTTYDVMQLLID